MKYVIEPLIREIGYRAIPADRISEPGLITPQIIQHLLDDDLVIADLTDRNPNVYYELAIQHVTSKPVLQIIQKGDGSLSILPNFEQLKLTTII